MAAGALYAWHGILLNPILSAAAMAMSSVSVVSNAQRLHRFRRPASAHEILHPKLSASLGQYSYLTTVAAAAIAVGIGLTAASYTTTAQRGMNGTLTWTESAGMPMRPTMGTMMTTEIPPVDAAVRTIDNAAYVREMGIEAAPATPARHPYTHRTKSIDYAIVLEGEIDMLLDDSEVHLEVGDVLVQQGTNHAWVNNGRKTCRIAFVLIDAEEPPVLRTAP